MPALPADVTRATRAARIVTSADSAVLAQHPNARDTGGNPQPGYFESATDAASALVLAKAVFGTFRRRFLVGVADEVEVDPLTAIPTWHLTDAETDADDDALFTRIEIDDETETTAIEVMT